MSSTIWFLLLFSHLFLYTHQVLKDDETCIERLLKEFGYLDQEVEGGFVEPVDMGFELFREYYNATEDEALQLIDKPRCGVPDVGEYSSSSSKWLKDELKWRYALSGQTRRKLAEEAFETWSNVTNLNFIFGYTDSDIIIADRKDVHKKLKPPITCSGSFDGPRGVLGHAEFPRNGEHSEIHIDMSENWYLKRDGNHSEDEFNLFAVILHEIGHALGLSHSKDPDSVMYAYYTDIPKLKLSEDDISGIQSIYGVRTQPANPERGNSDGDRDDDDDDERSKEANNNAPNVCDMKYGHLFLIVRDMLYIFYKEWVWIHNLHDDWGKLSEPLIIREWLHFLPSTFEGVSAIYQRPSGEVVLFDKDLIYMFEYPSMRLSHNYPMSLSNMGMRANGKVQAAVHTYRGRTLIFYDDSYYLELNECTMKPKRYGFMRKDYPKLPQGVDSAFRYTNGMLYFLKNGTFYEYIEFTETLVRAAQFDLSIFNIRCENSPPSLANVMHDLKKIVSKFDELQGVGV